MYFKTIRKKQFSLSLPTTPYLLILSSARAQHLEFNCNKTAKHEITMYIQFLALTVYLMASFLFCLNTSFVFPSFIAGNVEKKCDPSKQDICAATYKIKPPSIFLVRSRRILFLKLTSPFSTNRWHIISTQIARLTCYIQM